MSYKKRCINCFSCIICFLVHELFEQEFLNLLAIDWLSISKSSPKICPSKLIFGGMPKNIGSIF
jgi:hypothetical protein